jgi:hypothetical protein
MLKEIESGRYRMLRPLPIGETSYELSIQNGRMQYCSNRYSEPDRPLVDCDDFEVAVLRPGDFVTTGPVVHAIDAILGIPAREDGEHDGVWGYVPAEKLHSIALALMEIFGRRD